MKVCITPRTRCVVEGAYKDIANCGEKCLFRSEGTMKEAKAFIKRHKDFINGFMVARREDLAN
jgi:hypothetical protein